MDPQPASPDEMIGASGRDDRPESRAMTEHAEMGELMDDDRFEGFRWRQDEAPREAESMLARRASPASPLIADRHGGRRHAERGRVLGNRAFDEDAGAIAEPGLEDGGDRSSIGARQLDNELVAVRATFAGDTRAAHPGRGGTNAEEMEFTAIADRGTVAQAAASRELGPLGRQAGQVTADPGLSLPEEPLDVGFWMGPAPARRRWDGHDEAVGRMDRQPQSASAGRTAQDIWRQRATLALHERVGRHRCRW